ncbi:MAG: SH3-like domain-containing protein [Enterococcus lacertideformus]|uniref:SH3-like domain-containing protein n=1 Tax=Enterococcus lacertideformus TaxID=2771493 RepID=A0A931FA90_9ENTE|nr:SH3-like domain-containing protein [Enterococcus lacertideformus]
MLQTDIDNAREKVNALPDGEEKTALLAKVDQAFNGLQEIQLKGIEKFLFSRITVTKGKLLVRTQNGHPHYVWNGIYSTIQVTRNEETIFSKEYDGKTNYPASQEEVALQDGDIVTLTKEEATEKRMIVNHPELKPNNGGNYTYVVRDGMLIEDSRIVVVDARNAVKGLYEDEAQTIVKKTLLQTEIDSAREKVNALADGEEKTALLAKVDQAFNGLQEIQLKGFDNRLFSRMTVTNGKLVVRTEEGRPHYAFEENYAEITVKRGEQNVYHLEYYGNEVYTKGTSEVDLRDGDIVTVMKLEATPQRMVVNHPELKPNTGGNYTYVVRDGMLIEDSHIVVVDARNAVKGLYEDEAQTIVKKTLLQKDIDSAREKVNALPEGEEKTKLLAKVDQAFNGLQEIQLRGGYDTLFSRITVTKNKLLVRTSAGAPHFNWGRVYATIQVTRGEEAIYSREYVGTTSNQAATEEVDLQNGDIVTVTKEEANQRRFVVNHEDLKPDNKGNYTYVVQDGLLIEVARKAQLDAQNAVKGLYEDEAQTIVKKTLLQTDIDSAREKVNGLPNGELKNELLEKVDQAFNGLQEIQLKGGYNTLFSTITVTKDKLLVRTSTGRPHFDWRKVYATIQVSRGEEEIYSREYIGTTTYQEETEEVDLQNGDIVTITKEEATPQR